jgi:hypothetical protein
MSYLVPYHLALKPDEEVIYRTFILLGEADIPDDTYHLQEWYCPNPACHCQEVYLQVLAGASHRFIASIHMDLDPAHAPNPKLDPSEKPLPYAEALLKRLAQNLRDDPAYLYRLRSHYHQVKAVAANPSHPAHTALNQWAKTGDDRPPTKKSRRRRR